MNWQIEGRDSHELICRAEAPGNLSDREIIAMLQRLAAQRLSFEEVLRASLRRNHRAYAALLEPRIDSLGKRFSISVGSNPWFVAWKAKPDSIQ